MTAARRATPVKKPSAAARAKAKRILTRLERAHPKWGPILSKVAVLVLLILFLQKKPSGLFAIKGRHAES